MVTEDDLEIRHKKTVNERVKLNKKSVDNVFATLNSGTACVELQRTRSDWLRVYVPSLEKSGWMDEPAKLKFQPGIARNQAEAEEEGNTPTHFTKFENEPFPDGNLSGDDILQGGLGDCWILAPLGALANTAGGKNLIKAMITPNQAAASYSVRLYVPAEENSDEAVEKRITVDNYFATDEDKSLSYSEIAESGALWPLIVEKAMAALHGGYFAIAGGKMQSAYFALTGKWPQGFALAGEANGKLSLTQGDAEGIGEKIAAAFEQGKPVMAKLPPRDLKQDTTMAYVEDYDEFCGLIAAKGIRKSTLSIKLTVGEEEVTLRSLFKQVEVSEQDNGTTLISFKRRKNQVVPEDKKIDVEVSCQQTILQEANADEEAPEISGAHAYMIDAYDSGSGEVSVGNPHGSDHDFDCQLSELLDDYKAEIIIGT